MGVGEGKWWKGGGEGEAGVVIKEKKINGRKLDKKEVSSGA